MPRGSRSRSRPSFSRSSSSTNLPAPTKPQQPYTKQPNQKNAGLVKQAGAIGAGVFAGNMLSAAVLGPRGSNQDGQNEKPIDPCAKELKNFIDCSRNVNDLSLCEGFNEALKACRREYGPPPPP